jgi:hypothetical protein
MNTRTWLTKLSINADPGEDVDPGMQLNGFSLSNEELGNFLTRLSSEPLFKDVVLKYANETKIAQSSQHQKDKIKVIGFQIDCKIPRP